MLGANDASPISFGGSSQFIHKETVVEGNDVPTYWRAVDDPMVPKVISYGFVSGWGNRKPDRMIIAHWSGISKTKWDYIVNPEMEFTSSRNIYGTADSAIALYWDPVIIRPGAERRFETYYGLGSFYTTQRDATYGLQVFAPTKLTLNDSKTGYVEREFDIRVELDNSVDDAKVLYNVNVELSLPAELELAAGETKVKQFDVIEVGDIITLSWKVVQNLSIRIKPQGS